MNRRSFITAIPAAVAALTASRSLAGATSPVAASEAIVGPFELWDTVTGNLVGCYTSYPSLLSDLNEAFPHGEDRSELAEYAVRSTIDEVEIRGLAELILADEEMTEVARGSIDILAAFSESLRVN